MGLPRPRPDEPDALGHRWQGNVFGPTECADCGVDEAWALAASPCPFNADGTLCNTLELES